MTVHRVTLRDEVELGDSSPGLVASPVYAEVWRVVQQLALLVKSVQDGEVTEESEFAVRAFKIMKVDYD